MTCCNHHADKLHAGSCNQGRDCPERKQAAAYRANPHGYESALPVQFLGDEPPAGISGEAKLLIFAVVITWALVIALSFAV